MVHPKFTVCVECIMRLGRGWSRYFAFPGLYRVVAYDKILGYGVKETLPPLIETFADRGGSSGFDSLYLNHIDFLDKYFLTPAALGNDRAHDWENNNKSACIDTQRNNTTWTGSSIRRTWCNGHFHAAGVSNPLPRNADVYQRILLQWRATLFRSISCKDWDSNLLNEIAQSILYRPIWCNGRLLHSGLDSPYQNLLESIRFFLINDVQRARRSRTP